MGLAGHVGAGGRADLTPYVPRVVLNWAITEDRALWREIEGTMAFVDISGFTAMSERLSSRGKAGAEEVTSVMNRTFAELLDVAYAHGGGLLKFGGDALLLFFDGDDHTSRAAAAAYGMRKTLAAIGRPETSAGPVELRMHVGIHSGEFHFFLVGESHRELLVTGPHASRTVVMEATAEAGEILLSTAAASLVDPAALGDAKGEGVLLASAPQAPRWLESVPDLDGFDLEPFVPPDIRSHLATAAVEAEHRQAAVAFVHFGGVDALLDQQGPAAVADALDELVRRTQAAAGEFGVCFLETDIDRDGGKIVLVAGAPQTSPNDEERMLRAARALIESRPRIPVRIGVSRGRVFAGEVGSAFRRTYTILGDTAALAARLMARAEPGHMLAAADVVARSRTAFDLVELEPFTVKGKAAPVHAFDVGAVRGTRDVTPRPRVGLIGRERELAILNAALAPARMGFGTLVELVGEPGIGKSRIVEEVEARAADMRRLAAGCEEYEASTPYYAFRELLRSLLPVELNGSAEQNTERLRAWLADLEPDLVPWIPLLAVPLDVEVLPTTQAAEVQPAFWRARLNGVVSSLLGAVLAEPSLLLFEDVHWMDEASSDLLRHLATQLSTRPWFTCTTRRPGDGGFSAAEGVPPVPALTLRLDPLPPEDAKKLLEAIAGRPLTADEIDEVTERAGGNPLFIQELAASPPAERAEADELPETVEAMVSARIDRLAPADRALLRWASVLGVGFPGDVIEAVLEGDPSAAGDSEAWDRLAEFVERDPDVAGAFRFRHALIRDAAYAGLSFRRREELHARVARVYEERHGDAAADVAELLSLHFALGGVADRAWRYSVIAGERAQAKYANVEAAEFYRRALAAADQLPELDPDEVARTWEALAEVSIVAGRFVDAIVALREARRLAPPRSQPVLALKEGRLREEMGLYSDAIRWYGKGFRALEHIPDPERRAHWRVELALAYTQARFRQGRYDDCIRLCRRIVDAANDLQDLRALAHAYYLLHVVHTLRGDPERVPYRGIALPIYEDLGDLVGQASVLNNLGIDAYYEGRWEEATQLYERSRALRERIGDVVNVAITTNNIGEIKSDQGYLDEAIQLFEQALETGRSVEHRLIEAMVTANVGRAAARKGRFDEAEQLLTRAVEELRTMDSAFALEMEARLVELEVLRGADPERACARAAALLDRIRAAGGLAPIEALVERLRGDAALQRGDRGEAERAYEASLAIAREAEAYYELSLTLKALANAGFRDDADEAAEILERLGVVSLPRIPLP